MHARDQLPAIVFSNDSELCNQLVIEMVEKLEDLENKCLDAESSGADRAKLKHTAQLRKAAKQKRDQKKTSKQEEEEAKDAAEMETEIEAEADDYPVDPRFSFIR